MGPEETASSRPWAAGLALLGALLALSGLLPQGSAALAWNARIAGGAAAILALALPRPWASGPLGLLGLELVAAPLLLRAPEAPTYLLDQAAGALLALGAWAGPSWAGGSPDSEGPSGWHHRLPLAALAVLGWALASRLALFQLGDVPGAQFGAGTVKVLTSRISRALPVPDAGLGGTFALLDVVAATLGDAERFRSRPWTVLAHGTLVLLPAAGSLVLVALQPTVVGAWCLPCLAGAAVSLAMAVLVRAELEAALGEVRRRRRSGASWSRALGLRP